MRQVAIDAASIPKDAKIAVLEKSTAESEKMIAEARSDKLKQTAEIHQTQKRMTDMDYQIKALETELAERDSIIKILQKSAYHGKSGENVLSIPIQDTATSPLIFHPQPQSQPQPSPHLGIVHSSQVSSPASLSAASRQQATGVAEFFEGISRDMSSTTRGPLGKLRGETKVRNIPLNWLVLTANLAGEEQHPGSDIKKWDSDRYLEIKPLRVDGYQQPQGLSAE